MQCHADLPEVARLLPIAKELQSEGVQRYRIRGLSLESIVRQIGSDRPERLVIDHLGNGDIDPGVLVYLLREKQFDATSLEAPVDQRSGLLGISRVSGDMRRPHAAAVSNPDARLAFEMFCMSVRKQIAAMIAVLGGVDMLVLTGGIGENNAPARAGICRGLSFAGISLGNSRNGAASNSVGVIHDDASRCQVNVLPSQEDEQIARHAWALLA